MNYEPLLTAQKMHSKNMNNLMVPRAGASNNAAANIAQNAVMSAIQNTTDMPNFSTKIHKSQGYCFGKQSVVQAIQAIQNGDMVVVVDDFNRENEGDFIVSA